MSSIQVPPVSRPARRLKPAAPLRSPEHGRFLVQAVVWSLVILALAVIAYRRFFASVGVLTDSDTMDFAQIARNMAAGHGYATGILRPLAVTGFAPPDKSGFAPDISRAPLYPFVLMVAAMARGGRLSDNNVILISLILFLCTVAAVYRLGRTLFPAPGQAWIALLAAGLYGISGEALGYAVAGLPVTMAALMVTLLLIALHRAFEQPGRPAGAGSALVVGLMLGLCYLSQYSLLLLTIPALVYLFFTRAPERAWAAVGACALGFFIMTGGWLVRSAHLGHGNPFFTLLYYSVMDHTAEYPGSSTIYRSDVPPIGPLAYFYQHLPDMLARLGRGLTFYRDHLLEAFNVFLLAASVASLVWRFPDIRLNALRGFAAVCLLALTLVTALFVPDVKDLAPFAPLITVVAVGFLSHVVAEQNWEPLLQRTALWSLGLLVGLGALVQFAGMKPTAANPDNAGLGLLSDLRLGTNQTVITDVPWEVAWRIGVPAVWLPEDNDALQAVATQMAANQVTYGAVLLTPGLGGYDLEDNEAAPWLALARRPDAVRIHAADEAQLRKYVKTLLQKHDPRVAGLSPDQISLLVERNVANIDQRYGVNLDPAAPISDALASFEFSQTAAESDGLNSALFLPRKAAASGKP